MFLKKRYLLFSCDDVDDPECQTFFRSIEIQEFEENLCEYIERFYRWVLIILW